MSSKFWGCKYPNRTGWYWLKRNDSDSIEVLEVFKYAGREWVVATSPGAHTPLLPHFKEWAGPIAMPQAAAARPTIRCCAGGEYRDPNNYYWGGTFQSDVWAHDLPATKDFAAARSRDDSWNCYVIVQHRAPSGAWGRRERIDIPNSWTPEKKETAV